MTLSEEANYISNQTNPNTKESLSFFTIKNKFLRGRKREMKTGETHNKYSVDNIKRKILVHSINCITKFINLILDRLGYDEKFYKIKANCKAKEKKIEFISIKKMNIGQILCQEISPKYKKMAKNTNMIVFEKLKNEPIISNFLSENYSNFIKNIYCKCKKKINLGPYGFNENIYINDKIEMYIDLIDKNKNDSRYVEKLKEYFNNYFLN